MADLLPEISALHNRSAGQVTDTERAGGKSMLPATYLRCGWCLTPLTRWDRLLRRNRCGYHRRHGDV